MKLKTRLKLTCAFVAAFVVLFAAAVVPLPGDHPAPFVAAAPEHTFADGTIMLASIGCSHHQLTANGTYGGYLLYQMKVDIDFCWWGNQLPTNPDGTMQIRSIAVWFPFLDQGVTVVSSPQRDQRYWITRYSAWHERVRAVVDACGGVWCPMYPTVIMHILAGGGIAWAATQ